MRVATVDGLVTLFYDGSKELYNEELHLEWLRESCNQGRNDDNWESWTISDECKRYLRERQSWQQIIVVEGVTEIPEYTFCRCRSVKRVVFSNTVIRIKRWAFYGCSSLSFIKLSINIEVIEDESFSYCDLISVFIPPRCREIKELAFASNKNLIIFSSPLDTALGKSIIARTKLMYESHFEVTKFCYDHDHTQEVNNWLKDINSGEQYSLHRACSSFQPLKEVILTIVKAKGIGAFQMKNEAGITPSQYLKENPYADVEEMDIVRYYIAKMMD